MYLYHAVPSNMKGNTLYPLNELRYHHPEIYAEARKKYIGRESLMDEKIPPLDCLWNDVLHLSPVHPLEIKKALIAAGRNPNFELNYFQIDPDLLEPEKTIIYLYRKEEKRNSGNDKDFVPYNFVTLKDISTFPQATQEYYLKMIGSSRRPLLYHKIPHILYKGTIDTSNLPVISV